MLIGEEVECVCALSVSHRTCREGTQVLIHYFRENPHFCYFPEQEKKLTTIYLSITIVGVLSTIACACSMVVQIFG